MIATYKRRPVRATRWNGQEMSEVTELLGGRMIAKESGDELALVGVETLILERDSWLVDNPIIGLHVMTDAQFRAAYEREWMA